MVVHAADRKNQPRFYESPFSYQGALTSDQKQYVNFDVFPDLGRILHWNHIARNSLFKTYHAYYR